MSAFILWSSFFLLVLLFGITGNHATPLSHSGVFGELAISHLEINPNKRADSAPGTCSFQGNSDVYGLGIRLGVYLQWIASHIANRSHHCEEVIREFLATNTIFLCALLIAGVVLSSQPESSYAVEIAILLYIIWGTVVSVLSISGYRTIIAAEDWFCVPFTGYGIFIRLYLGLAVSCFGAWFWFGGANRFAELPCSQSIFFFAQANLFGWARLIFQIISAALLLLSGIILFSLLPGIILSCYPWLIQMPWSNLQYLMACIRGKKGVDLPYRIPFSSTIGQIWWGYSVAGTKIFKQDDRFVPPPSTSPLFKGLPKWALILHDLNIGSAKLTHQIST
jgi:hypothetical protein